MENFQHQLRNVLSLLENIEEDLNVSDFSPNEKQVLYTVAKATNKENNISDKPEDIEKFFKFQGANNTLEFLNEHPDISHFIYEQIKELF